MNKAIVLEYPDTNKRKFLKVKIYSDLPKEDFFKRTKEGKLNYVKSEISIDLDRISEENGGDEFTAVTLENGSKINIQGDIEAVFNDGKMDMNGYYSPEKGILYSR